MPSTPDGQAGLALVHEGWDHLKHQRPLAAWASWQRALRVDPEDAAARQALDRLAGAADLPATARVEYRFRTPGDDSRRARWDAAFRGRDLSDLAIAASAFAGLSEADPDDADAAYNQALCLAWLGRNADAVARLDRAVALLAATDFESAVSAWKLAEVLRQGGGAEALADEFRHAFEPEVGGGGDSDDLHAALGRLAVLRPLPSPLDPADSGPRGEVAIEEWLDRPWPEPAEGPVGLDDLPRVLAVVMHSRRVFRLSLASPDGLATVAKVLGDLTFDDPIPVAAPLPLTLLDAAIWTIRIPGWVDEASRERLYREQVEHYYEDRWIRRPRRALGGLTPIEAAAGGRALVAKLEALIRLREELADRPSAAELYQGYPFDRLRRRLGLEPRDPEAVDALDRACMSGPDLDRLDLAGLDEHALADAFRSSATLGDDARTARFAARVVDRRSPTLTRVDLEALFAPLVRQALADDRPDDALARVDEAIEVDRAFQHGRRAAVFATWRAELLARLDEPDRSVRAYESLLEDTPAPAVVALDGATTLLDNGHGAHARRLAALAHDLARRHGDVATSREAEALLDRLES